MAGGVKKGGAKGKGGGGKGKGGVKGGDNRPPGQPGGDDAGDKAGAIPGDPAYAAASIADVRPVWEEMGDGERAALLALPLAELEAKAEADAAREAAAAAAAAVDEEEEEEEEEEGEGEIGPGPAYLGADSPAKAAGPSEEEEAGGGGAAPAAPPPPPPLHSIPSGAIDMYDGDAAGAARALREGIACLLAARAKGDGVGGAAPTPAPSSSSSSSSLPAPPSYKVWRWPATGASFPDAASFRQFLVEEIIPAPLIHHLPPSDEPIPVGGLPPGAPPPARTPETPAEAALRTRMATLLARIHAAQGGTGPLPSEAAAHEKGVAEKAAAAAAVGLKVPPPSDPPPPATTSVPAGIDINAAIAADALACLEAEHDFVYAPIAGPVARFLVTSLPPARRLSSPSDLVPDDLHRLDPDDALRVSEWVTERVDALAAKVKSDVAEIKEMAEKAAKRAAKAARAAEGDVGEVEEDEEEEDEDESIGDIDLFTLDADGTHLIVTPAWLRHLATRILGEDGITPRPAKAGEDPHKVGLTLEWVFGSIVSTAEKARDAAKRALGSWVPTPEGTMARILAGLKEQAELDTRLADGRALLAEMLAGRKAAAELVEAGHDTRVLITADAAGRELAEGAVPDPLPTSLPDEVALAMLRREELLTRAKLRFLAANRAGLERRVRRARGAARAAEPAFERARRDLEAIKASPSRPTHHHAVGDRDRGGDPHGRGTPARAGGGLAFRTAAEMERHKAAVAEAALSEQVDAQTVLAAAQNKAAAAQKELHTAVAEMTRAEQEIKQLNQWRNTTRSLILQFEAVAGGGAPADVEARILAEGLTGPAAAAAAVAAGAAAHVSANPAAAAQVAAAAAVSTAQVSATAPKLRDHFITDVRKQLYTTADDISLFTDIRGELAAAVAAKADGAAALAHLEASLMHLACDDPGARIGAALALPAIQARLVAAAAARATRLAADSEAAVLAMEESGRAAEAAEKERRARIRAKAKEKERGVKEKAAAGRAQVEAAEAAAQAAAAAAAAADAAAAAKAREDAARAAAEAEDALLAARRAELMAGDDAESAHWRARAAAAAAEQAIRRGEADAAVAAAAAAADVAASAAAAVAPGPDVPPAPGTPTGRAPAAPAGAAPHPTIPPGRPLLLAPGGGGMQFGSLPPVPVHHPPAAPGRGAATALLHPPTPAPYPGYPQAHPGYGGPGSLPAGVRLPPLALSAGGPPPPPGGAHHHGATLLTPRTMALRASAAPFVPGTGPPPLPAGAAAVAGPASACLPPTGPTEPLPPPPPPPPVLPLPRGLVNATGRNNCFLNAVVQALAACPAVRAALGGLDTAAMAGAGGPPADVAVTGALRSTLASLATPAGGGLPPPPEAALPPNATVGAAVAAAVAASRPDPGAQPVPPSVRRRALPRESAVAVNPAPLRAALGALGGAATGCEASDMADAAEVLGELLASVHRAEMAMVGGGGGKKAGGHPLLPDPLLPTRRSVPVGTAPLPQAPPTAAMRLFGLEVVIPAPPVDGAGPSAGRRANGAAAADAASGFQTAGPKRRASAGSSSALAALAGEGLALLPAGFSPPAASGLLGEEGDGVASPSPLPPPPPTQKKAPVFQFVKFFHLAPASALREASARLAAAGARYAGGAPRPPPAFEEVLAAAEAATVGGGGGGGSAGGDASAADRPLGAFPPSEASPSASSSTSPPAATLLSRPAIMTVAIVWESARAADAAIAAVTAAIGPSLDAAGVFGGGAPPGPRYALRAVVCYLGHHYHTYIRAGCGPGAPPDAGCWLLLDDEIAAPVGGWSDAVAAMRADRAQPCLLFFEEMGGERV
jgi:hypothetical protein